MIKPNINKISRELQQEKIALDENLGQHLCIDEKVIAVVIKSAHLSEEETVLEIGAGTGLLTTELAKKAKKVIAIEKDVRFKTILEKSEKHLPKNVEMVFANALEVMPKRHDFQKIVANLPYQLAEPVLQFMCTTRNVKEAVLMVPSRFVEKALQQPFFTAFLRIDVIQEIPKEAFFPPPRVISSIITVKPRINISTEHFLLQQLFRQKDKKLWNGLREAIIDLAVMEKRKIVSKKEALVMISDMKLPLNWLEEKIARLPAKVCQDVVKRVMDENKKK